ncbi:MAG: TolC family protein, partial [Candidatus Margulisiibacteriota bacterium]
LDENITQKTKPDFDKLIEGSPLYLMAKYNLESARIDSQNTLSGFLPDVSLSAGIRKSGGDWPPTSQSRSWALNVSYPFFPGGTNIADVIIKNNALEAALQDFETSKKQSRYSVESAYTDLENKMESLKVFEFYLQTAREREKIARAKYMNGLMSYNDWDRIESSFITAQRDMLNAKKAAHLSEAAWYNSYGGCKE